MHDGGPLLGGKPLDEGAHAMTMSTYKSLGGPPSGLIVTRDDALALDSADPLRMYRDQFVIADPDVCYLDGNSLGRLPHATVADSYRACDQCAAR